MAETFRPKTENETLFEITRCAICHKCFVDPRLLPCGHTYCSGCLRTETSRTKGDFICPMMDGTTIQRRQIDSLPVNPVMAEEIKKLRNVPIEDEPQHKTSKH